ncbi:MAG: PocR ligand-binding domain-containing protein [Clostridia bacterium]|nr:PocR ligand-binding domain-containing protein [Clostridia bacterium]
MLNISQTNLYKIFRDFYTLTNMRVVLFSKEQEQLMEYPSTRHNFCDLICKNSHWAKKCEDCDRKNVEICSKGEKTVKYSCHLGLWECIVPIYDSNGILGYVMFGQVLSDHEATAIQERLYQQFSEEEFPGIRDAIKQIPAKSKAELDACITVLQALASYMLSNQWVTPQKSEFIRHMDKFIEKNIEKNIGVEDVCAEFHIRRTRLYSVAKDYLGCSIAEYIRKQKILYACRLLKETDDSVNQIAYNVGFCDYGHFSRIFRDMQGMTATAYRKLHRHR